MINRFYLFENWTVNNLRNSIWMDKSGTTPAGGYPLEWYEDELERRTGSREGYHEDGESA